MKPQDGRIFCRNTAPISPPPPVIIAPPTPPPPPLPPPPVIPMNVEINDAVIDEAICIIPEDTVPVLDKDMARRLTISYIYCVLLDSPNEFDMVDGKEKIVGLAQMELFQKFMKNFPVVIKVLVLVRKHCGNKSQE